MFLWEAWASPKLIWQHQFGSHALLSASQFSSEKLQRNTLLSIHLFFLQVRILTIWIFGSRLSIAFIILKEVWPPGPCPALPKLLAKISVPTTYDTSLKPHFAFKCHLVTNVLWFWIVRILKPIKQNNCLKLISRTLCRLWLLDRHQTPSHHLENCKITPVKSSPLLLHKSATIGRPIILECMISKNQGAIFCILINISTTYWK